MISCIIPYFNAMELPMKESEDAKHSRRSAFVQRFENLTLFPFWSFSSLLMLK